MDVAITTLGGFVSLLGMNFVSDMHIMGCEQFLSFISISLSVFQKATDHTHYREKFLLDSHLQKTYGKFSNNLLSEIYLTEVQ